MQKITDKIKHHLTTLVALSLLTLSIYFVISLPQVAGTALLFLSIYICLIWLFPLLWPIALLVSIPIFNFVPITGIFHGNEFDALILTTLGIVLLKQQPARKYNLLPLENIIFILFLLITIISIFQALTIFPSVDKQFLDIYHTHANIFRIGKAPFYAFALYWLYIRSPENKKPLLIKCFAIGAMLSIVILTSIILWEKGTLAVSVKFESIYAVLSSLLSFSIDYRPTGLFSSMHVGGGSLDSFIAIIFSFSLLLSAFNKKIYKISLVIAILLGLYCAFASVSRAVIGSTILSLLFFLTFTQLTYTQSTSSKNITTEPSNDAPSSLFFFGLFSLAIFWIYAQIQAQMTLGTDGAVFFPLITLAIVTCWLSKHQYKWLLPTCLILASYLILQSLGDRFDKGDSITVILQKGTIMTALIGVNAIALIKGLQYKPQLLKVKFPFFIFVTAFSFISIGFGSASLLHRFDEINFDSNARSHHWHNVWSTRDPSWFATLFGNGAGTMPLRSELNLNPIENQQFSVRLNPTSSGISVIATNQRLVQFITLSPNQNYTLYAKIKTASKKGTIIAALCNRNILEQMNHYPGCNQQRIAIKKDNAWHNVSVEIPAPLIPGVLGKNNTFELALNYFTEPLEIQYIALMNEQGQNLISNGDFSHGLARWFWVSDFGHLAWHSKNAFLHILYEQGILGLTVFILLLLYLAFLVIKYYKQQNTYALLLAPVLIINTLLLGSFITIFDDPQIATLWFFAYLFSAGLIKSSAIYQKSNLTLALLKQLNHHKKIAKQHTKITVLVVTSLTSFYLLLSTITNKQYGTSPTQILARFSSSQLSQYQHNYPSLQPIWNFIKSIAPKDQRYNYHPLNNSEFILNEINKIIGPNSITLTQNITLNGVLQTVYVQTENELLNALKKAQAGDHIILETGYYFINKTRISISTAGSAEHPIRVSAAPGTQVYIELNTLEGFLVSAPYWIFENLHINGSCKQDSQCEHAFHIVGNAHHTTIQNNTITNFNAQFKINGYQDVGYPDNGIIQHNIMYNQKPRHTKKPVTPIDAVAVSNWQIKQNYIADFAKLWGNKVSYGGFFKGGGSKNTFEQNIVLCEVLHAGGVRVGLSFGGGGTGKAYFRTSNKVIEQYNSSIIGNIIGNCPNDVGLYINTSKNTVIKNNILFNNNGIDVRFPSTSAIVENNTLSGNIHIRDNAQVNRKNNHMKSLSLSSIDDRIDLVNTIKNTLNNDW
jgi:hypothetical protein